MRTLSAPARTKQASQRTTAEFLPTLARVIDFSTLWPIALALLACGLIAGTVAGLLGVGGGIVLVPVLDFALQRAGVAAESSMHVAVATSLATIIPTSLASSRAHWRRGAIDTAIARDWAPGMVLGGLVGSLVTARTSDSLLALAFGLMATFVAVKMWLPFDHLRWRNAVPRGPLGHLLAGGIATISTLLGIGGGALAVPTMTLCGVAIHRAVGTAALFGLFLSVPGTLGYLLLRPDLPLPPYTWGLVNVPALVLVASTATLAAPLGARLAHTLDRRRLSQVFGVILLLLALRMLYRSLA